MKNATLPLILGFVIPSCLFGGAGLEYLSPQGWIYTEIKRFQAPEARQGVAAAGEYLYVISNHDIGKYRKATGERVKTWTCSKGAPLIHLNAGVVYEGLLYCAHSNFPGIPNTSSVEIWNPETLEHTESISLGRTDGSLTWIDRREGRWIACFVYYGDKYGMPGKGQEWTRLAEYDDAWRPTGRGWVFPADALIHLGSRGFSVSGGAIGPDGYLFITGHDEQELLVLAFPVGGSELKWVATIPMSGEGQSFAWDPIEPGLIHVIVKRARMVVTGRIEKKE